MSYVALIPNPCVLAVSHQGPTLMPLKANPDDAPSCLASSRKTAGRPHTDHNLMGCRYLPDRDRRPWARPHMVMDDPDDLDTEECEPLDVSRELVAPPVQGEEPAALRVSIVQSPVLNTFYHEHRVQLTLDTGATSNRVRASVAKLYGFPITPASRMARQADGVAPMDVIGKVHCSLTRGQC